MLVRDWPIGLSLQEIDLKMYIFLIHRLPLEYMTMSNAERIARKLGNFIQVEQAMDMRIILRRYMRVQ